MQSKKRKFNNKYAVVDTETGKVINDELAFDMVKSISKDCQVEGLNKKRKALKRLHNKSNLRVFKKLEGGGFGLYKLTGVSEMDIDFDSLGFYNVLLDHLAENGSYKVYLPCFHNKTAIRDHYGIGVKKLNKFMSELENNNLIKTDSKGHSLDIFINPMYYQIGKYVSNEVIEKFNIPSDFLE